MMFFHDSFNKLTLISDLQRFQVPYNLKEIPEVQSYLVAQFDEAKNAGDLQDLYRRRYGWALIRNRCQL